MIVCSPLAYLYYIFVPLSFPLYHSCVQDISVYVEDLLTISSGRIRFAFLTTHQKQGWKLIDINRKYNGGISGDYVISLMENYVNAKLSGMTCKVLRVFKTRNNSQPVNVTAKNQNSKTKEYEYCI